MCFLWFTIDGVYWLTSLPVPGLSVYLRVALGKKSNQQSVNSVYAFSSGLTFNLRQYYTKNIWVWVGVFLFISSELMSHQHDLRPVYLWLVMHAGTHPAHHVHVSGGHREGVLLLRCWHVAGVCLWAGGGGFPSYLLKLTAFIHLSALCQSAESGHMFCLTQSQRVNNDYEAFSCCFHQHQQFVKCSTAKQFTCLHIHNSEDLIN